jgi:hypothetical protein
MERPMRLRLARLACLALLCTALPARAAPPPLAAAVSPASVSASLDATLPVGLVWTVQINGTPLGPTGGPLSIGSVTSTQATLSTPGGQVLQVSAVALTVPLGAARSGSVAETFALSPATVATALRQGAGSLLLRRTFGVAPLSATATLTVNLGGSAGGPLSLARVALHFDDRSLVKVLRPGESALAIAEINYAGSGVLNGLWELAAPPSTLGEPVFVPLASVSTNLGGGGLTEVASPALPASAPGLYYLRFRVREPQVPFTGLVLRYAVEDGAPARAPIEVLGPEPHALLQPDTRFSWRPAPEAVAYRLEFFDSPTADEDSRPVSGQWVPAQERDALLSVLAQTHLAAGQAFHWRIVALDAQSQVVGRSALYEIRTP